MKHSFYVYNRRDVVILKNLGKNNLKGQKDKMYNINLKKKKLFLKQFLHFAYCYFIPHAFVTKKTYRQECIRL